MNETELNAKFAALCMQRNEAQNAVVNLAGSLAVAQARIKELEAEMAEQADQRDAEFGRLRARIAELETQLAAKDEAQATIEGVENV